MEPTFEDLYNDSGEVCLFNFPVLPINLFVDRVRDPLDVYGYGLGPWRITRSIEAAKAVLALGRVRTLSIGSDLDLIEWIARHEHGHNIKQIFVHTEDATMAAKIKQYLEANCSSFPAIEKS